MRPITWRIREILVEYTQSVKQVPVLYKPARALVFSPDSPILPHTYISSTALLSNLRLYYYFIHSMGRGHSHAYLRISVLIEAIIRSRSRMRTEHMKYQIC